MYTCLHICLHVCITGLQKLKIRTPVNKNWLKSIIFLSNVRQNWEIKVYAHSNLSCMTKMFNFIVRPIHKYEVEFHFYICDKNTRACATRGSGLEQETGTIPKPWPLIIRPAGVRTTFSLLFAYLPCSSKWPQPRQFLGQWSSLWPYYRFTFLSLDQSMHSRFLEFLLK